MRTLRQVLISVIFFVLIIFDFSTAQQWLRDANNPVLSGGKQGTWNHHLMWLSALYNPDSARYEMWFTATSGQTSTWRPMRIGYATSPDGITWNMYPDPVLEPSIEGWDKFTVETPYVIREENGQYKMWYGGSNHYNDIFKIGYATSPDGINWTKDTLNNPVMVPVSDAWQIQGFESPCVMPYEGGYKMWFAGWSANWGDSNIGYAISPDGITWTPDTINNPVLAKGTNGRWDDGNVGDPVVLLIGDTYHMWYSGKKPSEGVPWQTGWATSNDGIHWNKYNDVSTNSTSFIDSDPVIKREDAYGKWDEMYTVPGAVMISEDRTMLYMWYNGLINGSSWKVGLATAPVMLNVPGDYPTIQAAIDAAVDGNVVLVADGTYQENINFIGKAITVASHFFLDNDTSHISNTIIDGSNPSNPDSGSVVTFDSGEDTTSVLMGFTITGGSGTVHEEIFSTDTYVDKAGGGIFCFYSGAAIKNNKIINNHVTTNLNVGAGGAIAACPNKSNAYIVIVHNQIMNNSSSASADAFGSAITGSCNAFITQNSISNNSSSSVVGWGSVTFWSEHMRSIVIKQNRITGNITNCTSWASGGGVYIEEAYDATITSNHFESNSVSGPETGGGAIRLLGLTVPCTIEKNCIVNNNSSKYGGGLSFWGCSKDVFLYNNIIARNTATDGSGLNSHNSKTILINNTIVENMASHGGGLRAVGTAPTIVNTIIWGNTSDGDSQLDGSFEIRYSDIEGEVFEGKGNRSADPLFADSMFHLSENSPCIGNGIDSYEINGTTYFAPSTDFEGNERPYPEGSLPDIGAFEDSLGTDIEKSISNFPKIFALYQNYPNPFNPKTVIRYTVGAQNLVPLQHIDLSIYNILGQKVTTLVNKKQQAGNYQVEWDATGFVSGIYIYILETSSGFKQSRKLVLLK